MKISIWSWSRRLFHTDIQYHRHNQWDRRLECRPLPALFPAHNLPSRRASQLRDAVIPAAVIYSSCSARPRAEFLSNPRRIHSGQKDKEKEEYGLLWAVICFMSPLSPLPPSTSPLPTLRAPPAATLSGLAGGGRPPPPPHPHEDYGQILATSPKIEDGLHLGVCEYGSWIWTATVIMCKFSVQW